MSIVVWSFISAAAAFAGFVIGLFVRKPDEISWEQGYNRGWRDGMKQQNENKKKDGETIE